MNASKIAVSTIAAVAVFGTVGFVYAQSNTAPDTKNPPAAASTTTTTTTDVTTPAPSTPNASVAAERPAKADRN